MLLTAGRWRTTLAGSDIIYVLLANINTMMYGYGGVMEGASFLGLLTWLVLFVDLVLLGVWLWKNVSKK